MPNVNQRSLSRVSHRSAEGDEFLIALATQERRVLELKEELQVAEADLQCLKKQWAAHEAFGKQHGVQSTRSQQTMTFPASSNMHFENQSTAMDTCKVRQKLSECDSRVSHRKMFQGSRHTRTLSLLSRRAAGTDAQFSRHGDHLDESVDVQTIGKFGSTINASSLAVPAQSSKIINEAFRGHDKDMLIETGKQMVGDFRQGFWTFMGDLKQVTIGDDASPFDGPKQSQKMSTTGALESDTRI